MRNFRHKEIQIPTKAFKLKSYKQYTVSVAFHCVFKQHTSNLSCFPPWEQEGCAPSGPVQAQCLSRYGTACAAHTTPAPGLLMRISDSGSRSDAHRR